jgi:predicted permease
MSDPRDDRTLSRSVTREVEDEFAFHLAMRVRDLVARGTPPDEAERTAAAEFDVAGVMQECRRIGHRRERHMHRIRLLSELKQDLRFALRILRRRRAFAALAITTIALGIGATTAIFSVVDGVLLRALPFRDPGRLAAVWIAQPSLAKDPVLARNAMSTVLGAEEYYAVRDQTPSIESIGLWGWGSTMLVGETATEPVNTLRVSASLLGVLGERTILGRGFLPDENTLNGPRVTILSWEAWTTRFGGDSAVLGRTVRFDERVFTIVGVLPKGLRVDRVRDAPPFWIPALQETYDQPDRHNRSFRVVARLKPGASFANTQTEATRAMRAAVGDTAIQARVEDWGYDQTRDARAPLAILLAASGLLLLIGCVNVAMLMLGESSSRERELSARIALGASAGRVVRQLLAESLAISLAGAVVGAGIAWSLTRVLVAMSPVRLPGLTEVGIDWRALTFAAVCAAASGILFGLGPSLSLTRSGESALLRVGTGQSARNARRTQRWLVATEIALSLVLLVGGALLAQSLAKLSAADPGFAPDRLAVVTIVAPNAFYSDDDRRLAFYNESVRRLAALPGVEGVTAGADVPFTGNSSSSPVGVEGRVYDREHRAPFTEQHAVFANYFSVLGVPLRSGRGFESSDTKSSELVAVYSDAAARRDFPGESAVGRLVKYQGKVRRVVGVVGDVHVSKLTRDPGPTIYTPLSQHMGGVVQFVLRTRADLAALTPSIRALVRELDGAVSVANVAPLPRLVQRSYAEERYRTVIVAAFAALAALLAAVGLYGVTLRAVTRRTREVGIRVALGATPGMATRLMMRDTLSGVLLGVVIGLPIALVAANQLAPFLYHVAPRDPGVISVVLVFLAVVAAAASLAPARRAGQTSPAVVLTE